MIINWVVNNDVIKELKELSLKGGISKALVIDDDFLGKDLNDDITEILFKQDSVEALMDIIESDFKLQKELEKIGIDYQGLLNDEIFIEDIEKDKILQLASIIPSFFNTELYNFVNLLREVFGAECVNLSQDLTQDKVTSDTIIFMDYELGKDDYETSISKVQILCKNDSNPPVKVVFISKNQEFSINDEEGISKYNMNNIEQRTNFVRRLKNKNKNKNVICDYICKSNFNHIKNCKKLSNTFNNLFSSHKYYCFLNVLSETLKHTSEEVLNDFYLLNTRSINELLKDKIAYEGQNEASYFLEWITKRLSKRVVSNDDFFKALFEVLNDIYNCDSAINEISEDFKLKEMMLEDIWELSVNERNLPVEFGDVFEINYKGKPTKAILVTQQCTLSVRGDGNRRCRLGMLILEANDRNIGKDRSINYNTKEGEVIFDCDLVISYPISILELTSLKENGEAELRDDMYDLNEFYWNNGYKQYINKMLIELKNGINKEKDIIEIDGMLYKITYNNGSYKFEVDRIGRLDYNYALSLFQKCQAWWGRIGLPLDIAKKDLSIIKNWNLDINGSTSSIKVYTHKLFDGREDIGIDEDLLKNKIFQYIKEKTIRNKLKDFLQNNPMSNMNTDSEKIYFIIKGREQSNAFNKLINNGVYIDFNKDKKVIYVKLAYFNEIKFNNESLKIEEDISDFKVDCCGNYIYEILNTKLIEVIGIECAHLTSEDKYVKFEVSNGNLNLKLDDEIPAAVTKLD